MLNVLNMLTEEQAYKLFTSYLMKNKYTKMIFTLFEIHFAKYMTNAFTY